MERKRHILTHILGAACFLLLLRTTDLTIVDLGRHLRNGQEILAGHTDVLHKNFYSFTQPDFPFVNHHWLSGVVFYLLSRVSGFPALTLLYALLVTGAVLIMFFVAQRADGTEIAAALAALAIPIIAWRADVRPEGFTYLLSAATYAILSSQNSRWLYALPPVVLLWVNLHIGFVFAFVILGMFLLKQRSRPLLTTAGLCVIAAALNPSFLRGLLYPLNIFRNYGYEIAENQSIMAQAQRGLGGALEYQLFEFLLALAAGILILRWFKARPGSPSRIPEALLLGATAIMAIFAVRNLPIFGLLFIPAAAATLQDVLPKAKPLWLRIAAVASIAAGLLCSVWQFQGKQPTFGAGLRPGANATAAFLADHKIAGPVFNDFDIGGYLIFHGWKVFVDGRPEAYPEDFFKKTYIGALSDEAVWQNIDQQYHFNAIVFSLQDAFPPIEHFLLTRAWDPAWAPVYTDTYSLIFVRRNDANSELIRAFEIPKNQFRRP